MSLSPPSSVIFIGSDWYSASRVSVHHIVDGLHSRGARVLWINSIPVRFPSAARPDFWQRVQTKAKIHSRPLVRVEKDFYVHSPLYVPVFSRAGWLLNRQLVSVQVSLLRRLLAIDSPLVVGTNFTPWFALDAIKGLPLVMHFADKISAFPETSAASARRALLENAEKELIDACVAATCSSNTIYGHVRSLAKTDQDKVLYLPHGVDVALFRDALATNSGAPDDIRSISHPIAGYFGSLTEGHDKPTFHYAAKQLENWAFVFIGDVRGDYRALERLHNVYFLGRKPHQQIPQYGKLFDVAFMGRIPNEWVYNSFPIKTLEYLALGKPIVCSSPIAELETRFSEFVRITGSPQDFAVALQEELANDTPDRAAARINRASYETWDNRIDTILQAVKDRWQNEGE